MYFVEEGNISIRIEQEGGEVEISVLGKGQYFGELALVTHRPRAASAYASDNIKVACKYYMLRRYEYGWRLFTWKIFLHRQFTKQKRNSNIRNICSYFAFT